MAGYARDRLNYRPDIQFKSGIPIYSKWDYKHQPPGADKPLIMLPNVLPDLAEAMKSNPTLKVMVNGGYFDVSTPYFEGKEELRHLPVPPALLGNIEYHYYQSGHMVYVHQPTLVELHANVADFIRRTSAGAVGASTDDDRRSHWRLERRGNRSSYLCSTCCDARIGPWSRRHRGLVEFDGCANCSVDRRTATAMQDFVTASAERKAAKRG